MDKETVRQLLPEEPPTEVVNMAYRDHFSQLGGNITIYKRVNMTQFPELQREMSPDDWDEFHHRSKNIWAAECTCTCCGETWYTAWGGGAMKSIFVVIGEDGQTYPFYNDSPEQGDAVEFTGNDGFLCPVCGEGTTLTHVDKVRSGFMRRLLIMSVGNAGKYTAIFYWLLYRRLDIDGADYRHVEPWNAYVIDENGRLHGRTELTSEEMWPKDLVKKHDELSELNIQEQGKDSWARYLSGFKMIQDKYGQLQWTDGDLCIRLPANNGDLIREGATLRHCVGTYGKTHVTEETVIFFVRRYRRPERCYYTLCMDMRGNPKRTQLHGYGNERHGACKQYVHSIPQEELTDSEVLAIILGGETA